MSAHLERVLSRLEGVAQKGRGFMALCPAHDDHNPSLSVMDGEKGVVFKCHAGCSTESVLVKLGLTMEDLFFLASSGGNGNENRTTQTRTVDEYDYVDEAGNLLFQVVRLDPKGFRQRKPDGRGGWTWNTRDVRHVLYRLPEVLGASDVLVLEGEKDCDNALTLGFVATCNPGGAGKWKAEYSQSLHGKRVAIIADADEPGRKHAQGVADSLLDEAESVKVLEVPGAKDLSEWIQRGGTQQALADLVRNEPHWKPRQTPQSGFQLTSLGDLMREPDEHVSWLLADKLPVGGLSILSAKPKVGKSTLARGLCLAVSRGEAFLGCATKQGPVIYLALEEKRSEVRRHFTDLGATGEEPICIHAASAPQDAVPDLSRLTKAKKPVLLVVDPLFKLVRVRDEKAYSEVCSAIEPLLSLARESGAHVLLTHHNGKLERADATDAILGSTAIFGAVDSAIILRKTERYRTIQSCQRYGTDWPQLVLNFDPNARRISLGEETFEVETKRVGEAIVAYLAKCGKPQTRMQIEEGVGGKTAHLRKSLKTLCAAGGVFESGTGTKGDPFRYELGPSTHGEAGSESKTFLDSCSHIYLGTREQGSQKEGGTGMNAGDILVPSVSREPEKSVESREQEFWEGKL